MRFGLTGPARPVTISVCLMTVCVAVAVLFAATAHAALYKMVACASTSGAPPYTTQTNTASSTHPAGIFDFANYCGGQGADPPGDAAFMRIVEHEVSGSAGPGAYGRFVFETPAYVHFKAAGGFTREPNAFNAGWRARFWGLDYAGYETTSMVQGAGLANAGVEWATTSAFAPHLWPFNYYLDLHHFYFELLCVRAGGCDRANYNATDANALVFILSDDSPAQAPIANPSDPMMAGHWVRGTQPVSWKSSDLGSGIRMERVRVDGVDRFVIDNQANGACNVGASATNGEFARGYQPCPVGGPWTNVRILDTASLPDGAHALSVCIQDYSQYQSLNGTGGETCEQRTIYVDNTAPGKPASLEVTSANPARYLDHFGASFSLPPNSGSPIAKVHYYVTDDADAGKVVVPEKVLSATNPTSLSGIEGPAKAGAYTLHVAIEDQVGFLSPFVAAPIPHDTTPPAAPQSLHVLGSGARRVPKLDIQWSNLPDAGSPVDTARYQVIDGSGGVVAPTQAASGTNIETIRGIAVPPQDADLKVRVWLTDAEGNVGAPATAPIPRDTTPPAAPQDLSIAAPTASRASQGFDVRWRNIADDGAPIDAAHYRILNGAGGVVVPTTTVAGDNVERIAELETPRARGAYTLVLWLSDAEGNTGAPVKAPLSYSCVRADDAGGSTLSAGLGERGTDAALLRQGEGTTLSGTLTGSSSANVPICIFSRVVTDEEREFIGVALSDPSGGYRFSIPAGPSRELTAAYRPGQRELTAQASVRTRVRPGFRLIGNVVRNKGFATFETAVPGPRKDDVVVVLQVKSGKAWRVFRRCHTRASGRCLLRYRFTQTSTPTVYVMRAQVRAQSGYPYEQGSSKARRLRVLPSMSGAAQG